jgi:hypothetical protein
MSLHLNSLGQACTTRGPRKDFLWPRGDWRNCAQAPEKYLSTLIKYNKIIFFKEVQMKLHVFLLFFIFKSIFI